jgi:DNA invertase Pin-like site-specific DNA recombinase
MTDEHDNKFAGLNRACREARTRGADYLMVHNPHVLGDNYDELVRNLNKIAEAGLRLLIIPPSQRTSEHPPDLHPHSPAR